MQPPSAVAAILWASFSCLIAGADKPAIETFPLTGVQDLLESKVKVEPVEYQGRKAVRLTRPAEGDGLAFLRDIRFDDGTIEADVALKVTTPAGVRNPGFVGIAFRSRPDAAHYDLFYIRPGNSHSEDQAMRNHSVQYVAAPGHDWYTLRRAWPWVYEAYADMQPEAWTHIRIVVEGRRARLYINESANPVLIVDGLKGQDLEGAVGLWGSPGQDSYFSNVRISHAKPQPIKNGSDAAGTWEVKYATDAAMATGLMTLEREGDKVSGRISGLLGSDLPVTGTWRDGYLELGFSGTWPRPAGAASAMLAGWVDGNAAKGRISISGRADGSWTATKKE